MKQSGRVFLLLPGSSQIWVPCSCVFLRFKGKPVENNYTHGRKFEKEKCLPRLRWATVCISSPQIVFVTMQCLWGAWFSAWNLWCIVLEVATTNTRCLHLAELKVLKRKVALPGKVEAAYPVPRSLVLSAAAWTSPGGRAWVGEGSSFFHGYAGRACWRRSHLEGSRNLKSWRLVPLETLVRWAGSLVNQVPVTQMTFLVYFDRDLPFWKARDQQWVDGSLLLVGERHHGDLSFGYN